MTLVSISWESMVIMMIIDIIMMRLTIAASGIKSLQMTYIGNNE